MAEITLKEVRKAYGRTPVIHGVDLDVASGELIVIVGPSGCGKSTLLRMVAGLETVTAGEIAIRGRVVNDLEPRERDIAMVFQNYALYPHMSVAENMAYGLKIARKPKAEIEARVAEAAAMLELAPLLSRKPRALSGGQRQRVAMGRAIVRQPAAFLFDEPLSNLDARLRVQMRVEIRELQRRLATTALYVTHDQVEAMTMADRMVVMNGGRAEQVGAPLEVYDRPATTFVAGFIGAPPMNLMPNGDDTLGVRAEHLRLVPEGQGRRDAELATVEPLGAETLLHLRLSDGALVIARQPGPYAGTGVTRFGLDWPQSAEHRFGADGRRIDA
ncbi:MAG: sn-glycerol-3-phosphate ABC transporter ATP-binding protein UgpC [Pseudomonadota bacterium]